MKALLGLAAIGAGVPALGYLYLRSKVTEEVFPEAYFYYKEHQSCYKNLGKEFEILEKIKERLRSSFDGGLISIMGLYYDNPQLIKDPNMCRATLGFWASKDIPQSVHEKIGAGFTYKTVSSFRAMTIPMLFCKSRCLMNTCTRILMKQYIEKYAKELEGKGINQAPVGEMYSAKRSIVFVPVPGDAKKVDFVKASDPELNVEGRAYEKKYEHEVKVAAAKPIDPHKPSESKKK